MERGTQGDHWFDHGYLHATTAGAESPPRVGTATEVAVERSQRGELLFRYASCSAHTRTRHPSMSSTKEASLSAPRYSRCSSNSHQGTRCYPCGSWFGTWGFDG